MEKQGFFNSLASFLKSFQKKQKNENKKAVRQALKPRKAEPTPPPKPPRYADKIQLLHSPNSKPLQDKDVLPASSSFPIEKEPEIPSPQPRLDKKGIRVLDENHDFYQAFITREEKKRKKPEPEKEDFAKLIRDYADNRNHDIFYKEKHHGALQNKPLTMAEQLKAFPGPQSELDLHGHTSAEAETITNSFIWNCRYRGLKTIRIIVGKGLHSENKAVLPDVVHSKLIELKQQKAVLAYKWEQKEKHKSGAIIVYLAPLHEVRK